MTGSNGDTVLIIEDLNDLPEVAAKTAVILQDKSRPDLLGVGGFIHPGGDIRNSKGHYLAAPPWSAGAWTGDEARAAVKKREALRSEAIQDAIIRGTGAEDLAGGVGRLAAEIVKIVKSGRQDRDKIQAFKELMRFAGLAYDLGRGSGPDLGGSGGSGLSSEAIQALNVILPAIEAKIRGDKG